jgi:lipoyl(octanoyl) transferase
MTETGQLGPPTPGRTLSAYLLGTLGFDALIALQRRLVYEIGGDRNTAAVLLCDHPPTITIGREGSRAHIRPSPEELQARRWPVRWVSRGGGTMLHLPGQVACYPIFPLDRLELTVARYLELLQTVVVDLLDQYSLTGVTRANLPGVWVNGRRIAHVGVAVRDGISCFGLILNAEPDLEPFREVKCDGDSLPMTSLQRETTARVRLTGVRQQLLDLLVARFGFDRVSIFHAHPAALPRPCRHVAAPRS